MMLRFLLTAASIAALSSASSDIASEHATKSDANDAERFSKAQAARAAADARADALTAFGEAHADEHDQKQQAEGAQKASAAAEATAKAAATAAAKAAAALKLREAAWRKIDHFADAPSTTPEWKNGLTKSSGFKEKAHFTKHGYWYDFTHKITTAMDWPNKDLNAACGAQGDGARSSGRGMCRG